MYLLLVFKLLVNKKNMFFINNIQKRKKMKKLIICIFFIILNFDICLAFEYTEEDKNMFYDAFLDGYFLEMAKIVNKLDIESDKKEKYMNTLKESINRQELVNSSWDCIKKYPIQQIVTASVVCTSDWNDKQVIKNKKLYEMLK